MELRLQPASKILITCPAVRGAGWGGVGGEGGAGGGEEGGSDRGDGWGGVLGDEAISGDGDGEEGDPLIAVNLHRFYHVHLAADAAGAIGLINRIARIFF
jgi:hypothetical protein